MLFNTIYWKQILDLKIEFIIVGIRLNYLRAKFGGSAKRYSSRISVFSTIGLFFFWLHPLSLHAELIEPTRTLTVPTKEIGKLSVSSEPPGLAVGLDGIEIGETPVFEKGVEAGSHVLRVRDLETVVFIMPGMLYHLSCNKGSFIEMPIRKESEQRRQTTDVKRKEAEKLAEPSEKKENLHPSYFPLNPYGPIYPRSTKRPTSTYFTIMYMF